MTAQSQPDDLSQAVPQLQGPCGEAGSAEKRAQQDTTPTTVPLQCVAESLEPIDTAPAVGPAVLPSFVICAQPMSQMCDRCNRLDRCNRCQGSSCNWAALTNAAVAAVVNQPKLQSSKAGIQCADTAMTVSPSNVAVHKNTQPSICMKALQSTVMEALQCTQFGTQHNSQHIHVCWLVDLQRQLHATHQHTAKACIRLEKGGKDGLG